MKARTILIFGVISVVAAVLLVAALVYFAPYFTDRYQTLISALVAFLGGGAAILAAWLGAKALSNQTAETALEQRRLEDARYKKESHSVAVSLAGELKAIGASAGLYANTLSTSTGGTITGFSSGKLMMEYMLAEPIVFRAVASQLGTIDAQIAEATTMAFHSVIKWNGMLERLRDNVVPMPAAYVSTYAGTLRDLNRECNRVVGLLEKFAADAHLPRT